MKCTVHTVFLAIVIFSLISVWLPAAASPAGFTIAGIVIDSSSSQPLNHAEVTISLSNDNEHTLSFLTSIDGRFCFTNLAPGKYSLSAQRRGYTSQTFNQHGTFSTAIVVGPALDTEHIRFRLSPGAIIAGTVLDDSGDPVRNAAVLLLRQDFFAGSKKFQTIDHHLADDQGHYRFAHLQPGIYVVAVSAQPWFTQSAANSNLSRSNPFFDVVYPITYYSNAYAVPDATKLTLTAGAVQSADITLHTVPSIHLFVQVPSMPSDPEEEESTAVRTDTPLRPGPAIEVEYNINGSTTPADQEFSENFEPTRTEVSPGLMELSGLRPGAAYLSMNSNKLENFFAAEQSLQLSQNTEINLNSDGSQADIHGSVLVDNAPQQRFPSDDPEAPFVEGLIFKSPQTGKYYFSAISRKGEFSLTGFPFESGAYDLTISDGDKFLITSVEIDKRRIPGNSVTISTGQPLTLTIHATRADCTVKGFALKDGKPLAGTMLILVPQDATQHAALFHRDQSDSDGSFTMGPIFPGRYTLLAIENGWDLEWANPAILFKYLPNGIPITLKPSDVVSRNPKVE